VPQSLHRQEDWLVSLETADPLGLFVLFPNPLLFRLRLASAARVDRTGTVTRMRTGLGRPPRAAVDNDARRGRERREVFRRPEGTNL
jgi:hypothetical protein